MPASSRIAHLGRVLHFRADPGTALEPDGAGADCAGGFGSAQDIADPGRAYEYWERGVLIVTDGHIEAVGPAATLLAGGPSSLAIVDHGERLILPGFIDPHIHYPQTDVIGSGGSNLLDWLERHTFPAETRFADPVYARATAEFFLDELLRNGTTTAQVLGTVHRASVEAFFEAAAARGLRMIAGQTLMDRHCPEGLRDTPAGSERDMRELIDTWHGRERLHYAITPRFAPTSSVAQLEAAGRVARDHPEVAVHSHLAENPAEIEWVRTLFPGSRSYLDVYDRYGLLRERSTYAHCLYLDAEDRRRFAASGAGAAFCPTSNLYLGSGLFDLAASDAAGMPFALATDVGGGTSFSMLRTMGEAYQVAQLLGQRLTPLRAFYLATLAGARILGLADRIGQFAAGTEADFIVLDPEATPLLARRMAQARTLSERLLLWMVLGDDRAIAGTYVMGERAPKARPLEGDEPG